MTRAFLFDYDGVMTAGVKDGIPATRLAHNLGISYDNAAELTASIWNDLSIGKLSENEAWNVIEKQHGKSINLAQRDIWYTWEELEPLPAMVELVQMVKSRSFPVGVISNVLPASAELIERNGGYDEFDFQILSCQTGARKPDPAIYTVAMAKIPDIPAADIVFLDDRKTCIDAARKLGMKTIHVTDHDIAIRKVLEYTGPV